MILLGTAEGNCGQLNWTESLIEHILWQRNKFNRPNSKFVSKYIEVYISDFKESICFALHRIGSNNIYHLYTRNEGDSTKYYLKS